MSIEAGEPSETSSDFVGGCKCLREQQQGTGEGGELIRVLRDLQRLFGEQQQGTREGGEASKGSGKDQEALARVMWLRREGVGLTRLPLWRLRVIDAGDNDGGGVG